MKKREILKLRPRFKFGSMVMVDWYEITEGNGFFCIKNGLRHSNGKTRSPFFYEDCVVGKKNKKIALNKFTEWWESLNNT
jgi:hypothetical protein